MTEPNSPEVDPAGDDQAYYEHTYGHGRMPGFMKVVWIGFLIFSTWYLVTFMFDALQVELGS